MDITKYSIEDLQKEIENRKAIQKEEDEKDKDILYVFMYGSEGCEGLAALKSEADMKKLDSMKLRARFNSQRNIKLYSIKVPFDLDQFYATIEKFPKIFLKKANELNF